jgi:16S rRNA C967 or C1407 C5-methylase (RsmB/RsmF family)
MFPPEFEKLLSAEAGAGGVGGVGGVGLGASDAEALLAALDGEPVTSVRFNPFKLSAMPEGLEGVPWNRYGAYLAERPIFTLDPAMHAGAYYVQEASSQFVEHIIRQAVDGTTEGLRILDLCAAPGGKTTLYSTLAGTSGLVVANEVIRQRAGVLADNVRRWGVGNVAVSCNEPKDFAPLRHFFDVLAVDAPCSGEGMFRKNREARAEWSVANVELCAARQRRILAEAWDALRPGGVLIYSTCTFNRRENEENVAWLADNFAVEPLEIALPAEWGVESSTTSPAARGYSAQTLAKGEIPRHDKAGWQSPQAADGAVENPAEWGMVAPRGIQTFRFYPHRLKGEGFFAAVMRKADGRVKREFPRSKREPLTELTRAESRPLTPWVASPEAMKFARVGDNCYAYYRPQYQAVVALASHLNVIYSGVCMGQIFGGKLRPDHALALFHDLARGDGARLPSGLAAVTALTRDEALDYLRKRDPADVERFAEGLNLLTHNDLPIGWIKRIGHRTNTLLPNSFRIVNL